MSARAAAAAILVGAALAGCPIGPTDPLPGFGAQCTIADGHCDIEHVCVPQKPGEATGLCAPIGSFGACDAKAAVTHSPGRVGEDKDATTIEITGPEDFGLIDGIRSVTGQVRVFKQGPESARIGDLCAFRALQRVGNGFAVADSDVSSLDGLESVTSVDGGVGIFDDRALTSLDGLQSLVQVGGRQVDTFASFDVVIAQNPLLTDAVVDAFVADLKARTGTDLAVVACNNGGRPCAGDDAQLVGFLVANGFGG